MAKQLQNGRLPWGSRREGNPRGDLPAGWAPSFPASSSSERQCKWQRRTTALLLPPRSLLGQKIHREAPGKGVPSWPGGVAGAPRLQMQEARLGAGWLRGRWTLQRGQAPGESRAACLCEVDWTRGLASGGDYRALRKDQEVCPRWGQAHRHMPSLPSAQVPTSCPLFPRGRFRWCPQTAAAFGFAETTYIA